VKDKKEYLLGLNPVNEFVITTRSAKASLIRKRGFCNSTIKNIIPIRRK
jgi:hypothetical protein